MEAFRRPEGVEIRVDGRLEEPVWGTLPAISGFVQKEPVEGTPAINDSEVWLLYDADALYVGAVLHDEQPDRIARNMARRDATYEGRSDYFEVMLDPNRDRLTGYRFRITAGGVQTDRYLYDDDKEDSAWDAVYETAVTIDPRGWIVEMRIPLSQIRYEMTDTVQTWGIQFGRRRATDNELTRFSMVSRLRPGRVSQFGTVTGLRLEGAPRRLEVLPYLVSQAHRGPSAEGDPFFDGSDVSGRVGLDLSYGLGTAFTLDATLNPDFGQVEADPAVVNLSAFETFFQERRPFFVEDARVFDYRLSGGENSLFYSRRVGRAPQGRAPEGAEFTDIPPATSILGAAKLTGRTSGGLSVGALVALTEEEEGRAALPGADAPTVSFPVEPRSRYGVIRLRQDFREGQSWVGGIGTAMGRSLPGDGSFDHLATGAYSAGVDFEHTWGNREWAVWGFLAGSHVRGDSTAMLRIQRASNHYLQRPDLEWSALEPSTTSLSGAEWRLQAERRVGHWRGAVWAGQVSSGMEVNDLGFSTTPERLDGGFRVGYQQVAPGRVFRSWSSELTTFHNFSHEILKHSWSWSRLDWGHTAGTARLTTRGQLLNFWNVNLGLTYRPDVMSRRETRGGPRMALPGSSGFSLGVATDNRRMLFLEPSLSITRGRAGVGDALEVGLGITVQPSTQVVATVEPTFSSGSNGAQYVLATDARPHEPTYGRRYLFADIEQRSLSMVTRLNWTFSPTLSLELFAQPFVSAVDYLTYKQLRASETFAFDAFGEGTATSGPDGTVRCVLGGTCVDGEGTRWIDLDGDQAGDVSFEDKDFNLRSLRSTAVLRWEYRPGSTLFFVWQRRQAGTVGEGAFDFGRDVGALLDAPADDVFIIKANVWLAF